MQYADLGETGLRVSRIGFGCEPLGGTDWGPINETAVMNAVGHALDLGINLFDTADVYGLGLAERRLSEALGTRRHDVVIVTKVGLRWREPAGGGRAEVIRDCSPTYLEHAVEASLGRLRLDAIPVYLVHWPDGRTPVEDIVGTLERLEAAGKIRAFGVSNFSVSLLSQVRERTAGCVVEQQYSLIAGKEEREVIEYCGRRGLPVLAYGALAQGLLSGKYRGDVSFGPDDRRSRLPHFVGEEAYRCRPLVERLVQLAGRRGTTPAELAIQWALAAPAVTTVIVGAKSREQVTLNARAAEAGLTESDLAFLGSSV